MANNSLYVKLYHDLRSGIETGVYPQGSKLPTEHELCSIFNVSRTTVRKALEMLTNERRIEPRSGYGTIVLKNSSSLYVQQLKTVYETLSTKYKDIKTRTCSLEKIICPDYARKAYANEADDFHIYKIERILEANGEIIAYIQNHINASLVPDFDIRFPESGGLYEFITREYNIVISFGRERITAVNADFTMASYLQVPIGTALLSSSRLTMTGDNILDYGITKAVASRYEFEFTISPQHSI